MIRNKHIVYADLICFMAMTDMICLTRSDLVYMGMLILMERADIIWITRCHHTNIPIYRLGS
jgi:hypothetical protein